LSKKTLTKLLMENFDRINGALEFFFCNINHCNDSAPCWDLDWTIKILSDFILYGL